MRIAKTGFARATLPNLRRVLPETKAKRILTVATLRDRITFINGDGIQVMKDNAQREDGFFH
jgi:hypothetical protein